VLFTNDQRRRILAREMTATIRAWQAPQVKPGKRYRFDDDHELVIHTVDLTPLDALTEADLAAAGFPTRADFDAALPRFANDRPTGPFHVVRFTLEPRHIPPPVAPSDLDKLRARLDKLDRLSPVGPWTHATLSAIAANPRLVSTKLAGQLNRERFSLKTDIRKLKALGLTRSHDVGYEITELGHQLLAAADTTSSLPPQSEPGGLATGRAGRKPPPSEPEASATGRPQTQPPPSEPGASATGPSERK
jgi:hypothetical protein